LSGSKRKSHRETLCENTLSDLIQQESTIQKANLSMLAQERAEKERERQLQADQLFEGGDPGVGVPTDSQGSELSRLATDAQFSRLPSRAPKPASGQVIGTITPRNSLTLARHNLGPELPFTRASQDLGDTKVTPPPPSHTPQCIPNTACEDMTAKPVSLRCLKLPCSLGLLNGRQSGSQIWTVCIVIP